MSSLADQVALLELMLKKSRPSPQEQEAAIHRLREAREEGDYVAQVVQMSKATGCGLVVAKRIVDIITGRDTW